MARPMSVFVSIGGKLLPSLGSSVSAAERRMGLFARNTKLRLAETRLEAKKLTSAMKPLATMAVAGGLTMGVKDAIGNGASFIHEIAALRLAGRTTKEVGLAIRQAHKTASDVPTSTLIDNLKILRETTGAYGDMAHALHNLSFNQRLGYMMTNVMGMDRESSMHALVSGIQALEIRGSAMDPKRYQKEMSALFQASSFFAGKEGAFTPDALRAFAKTGAIPLKLMNERFMTRILPAMITEVGSGDIIGTQATAFNNWVMGRVGTGNKSAVDYATRLGLVPPKGMGGNLSKTGWTAGTMVGTNLALSDPLAWAEKILLPRLSKMGVNVNDTKALSIALSQLMTKETARRYAMTLTDRGQRMRLHKDEGNINKAMSSEEGYAFMLKNDPLAAWAKVMSKVDNLATTLGEKVFTAKTINAMNSFANGIEWITGAFDRHPMFAKGAMALLGFGAVTATLAVFNVGLGILKRTLVGLFSPVVRGGAALWRLLGPAAFRMILMFGTRLVALAPLIVEGIGAAFALLSNPIGWAVLAAAAAVGAGVLIWNFRTKIMAGLRVAADWGSGVVDSIIASLASAWPRLKAWVAGAWRNTMPTWLGGTPTASPAPAPLAGRSVGAPPPLLRVVPARRSPQAVMPGGRGPLASAAGSGGFTHNGDIIIHGANDPHSTRRIVRQELGTMAKRQAANFGD